MTKTALVVDDSKSARFALRKFLEGFNYKVETSDSAAEAYRQLAAKLPDVIFLDHIMPGVDGFEALRVIRSDALTSKVPVVICSSNEGEDFVHQAKLRGATDVLQKPPSPEQIAGVLANLGSADTDLQLLAPPPKAAEPAKPELTAMERLKATIPPKVAPAPTVTAPPTLKVHPIREPAVTIQQAVMKSLRDAIPTNSVESRAQAVNELPAVPSFSAVDTEPATASYPTHTGASDDRIAALRQELFADIAGLRAQLSQLQSNPASEDRLRAIAQEAAKSRTNALAQNLEQHLTALQTNIDAMLRAQNERLDQALQLARQAAAEEAERVVMNAAQRIADQMTSSMLKTMGQQLASLGRNAF